MLSLNSMTRSTFASFLVLQLLCFTSLGQVRVNAQTAAREPALTVEEVVKLTHSGFAEEIIITKIKKNAKAFDLNTDELIDLKKEGVSDNVIKYLLDPTLPYAPPAPPAGSATGPTKPRDPGKKYPADPHASNVPAEPGLYFFPEKAAFPVKVELKFLLGTETPKKLLKKGKTIGYLIGPHSKTRIQKTGQTFYVRLPDGKEIEELVLVSFSGKNDRRELELGPAGPKQELNAEDIRPRESLEVGPRLFKLSTQQLTPGEYLFLFMGSAEPAKGVFGKGYDFGVQDAGDKTSTGTQKLI